MYQLGIENQCMAQFQNLMISVRKIVSHFTLISFFNFCHRFPQTFCLKYSIRRAVVKVMICVGLHWCVFVFASDRGLKNVFSFKCGLKLVPVTVVLNPLNRLRMLSSLALIKCQQWPSQKTSKCASTMSLVWYHSLLSLSHRHPGAISLIWGVFIQVIDIACNYIKSHLLCQCYYRIFFVFW